MSYIASVGCIKSSDMTSFYKEIFLFLFVYIAISEAQDNSVIQPKVEALYPKGFRVTLEDDGYSFFGFRGNINKEFQEINEGDIKGDVPRPTGKKWIYKNRNAVLKIGDTIFYWIYVLKNKKGHMITHLEYTVNGFVNEDGTPVDGIPGHGTPKDQSIHFPDPLDSRFDNCVPSKTVVQGSPFTCTDQLLFSEEFNQTSLRQLKNWNALIQFPADPDYPFNMYTPESTVRFEDGSLVITPVLTESGRSEGFLHQSLDLGDRCTGKADTSQCKQVASGAQILPPVMTAKFTTKNRFNFMFGRIEVRAKLPAGSWLLSEINLESFENAYGPNNYESGLMRIAFVRGNPELAKKLYGGPVLSDSEPFRSSLLKEKIGIENWHKDFHNYSMIWRPDGIDMLVDGEQYGTVNPGGGFFEEAAKFNVAHASHWQKGTIMAPLDQMFYITLGLRAGGVKDFSDDLAGKPWRNTESKAKLKFWRSKDTWYPSWQDAALMVDHVKVYAL